MIIKYIFFAIFLYNFAQASDESFVITAKQYFDSKKAIMIPQPTIFIKNGIIESVESKGIIPANIKHIDLNEFTLLPGLIDMHAHIDNDPTYGGYGYLQYNDRFWAFIAAKNAKKTLDAGFTTIRNLGSDDWNDVGLKQAIDAGITEGPNIIPAGFAFGATGGHCDSTYFPPSFNQKRPYNADDPAEGRRSVRELRKYGAAVIKICATGGVFSRNTEPGQQQLSYEEMKAIADDAHMLGLKVAAHAHGASGIRDAIRAGIDTIEHATFIDDEGIKLAIKHGTWLSMDIYNTDYTQSEGVKNGVLPENIKKDKDTGDIQRLNFQKAYKMGAKMVYGTDTGVHPHGDNGKQFKIMVRFGMPEAKAIQTATYNSAMALGIKNIGEIKNGYKADIIGVRGDPLKDISLLEKIGFVMKNGKNFK